MIDFKKEFLEILNEIKENKEKIERYDIFTTIFAYIEHENYKNLLESKILHDVDYAVDIQKDVEIRKLITKFKDKLYEALEIKKSIEDYGNLKFSMEENLIIKRLETLEKIKNNYMLFDDYENRMEFYLKVNGRLLEFIKFKEKLSEELSGEKKIKLNEYNKYFEKLYEFSDLKLKWAGLWGEPRSIISGIDIETQKLIFQMNTKMSGEISRITEEKIQNLENQSLRNLTGFFFVFTLIASNITLIFKASESMNVFYFISLIFIINSVVIFAVMTIFSMIIKNKEKHVGVMLTAIVGIILGIGILWYGSTEKGQDKYADTIVKEVLKNNQKN